MSSTSRETPPLQSAESIDQPLSAWAPLRTPLFMAFWIASLVSNLGTWVHEVGASWLMTTLNPSPEMVSAVRTSMALPIVVLAIPAGVLADRIDRRRLLIITQLLMLSTTSVLAALCYADRINEWALLGMTFLMGLGMVVHVPTWQASIPELVPKRQLSRAVALGSMSFNLARAVGPAAGGLLIASIGVWAAFAVNAISFAAVIGVLISWKRETVESTRGLSFRLSLFQGIRYVIRNSTMRNVMLGVLLFVIPGSALWSLLPLVAKQRMGWDADGFGLLVASVGIGAVAAARMLPSIQSRFGVDRTIACAMLLFAFGLFIMSSTSTGFVIVFATLIMGAGWMMTLTTLNASAQVTLPSRMRARGMSVYITAIAISMSFGSFAWGQIAGYFDIGTAQKIAAATLVVTAAMSLKLRLETELY